MKMSDWAKNEVKLACDAETKDNQEDLDGFNYGVSCYNSALKAYLCMLEDRHSGFSFEITSNILKRLLESKPLTPITAADFTEEDLMEDSIIQCKRMPSLFKEKHKDGTVTYFDVDRCVCYISETPDSQFTMPFVTGVIDELFPITMPYMPQLGHYEVCCGEFLTDEKNGDYDTFAIFTVKTPEGDFYQIDKYYIEDSEQGMIEITKSEFYERVEQHYNRISGAQT